MPFNNSYIDSERSIPPDAREKFVALAPQVVREPISTHLVRTDRNGKACFLVIDMATICVCQPQSCAKGRVKVLHQSTLNIQNVR